MSAHHCHAIGCKEPCPPRWLMCRPHWSNVPKLLQDEVWRTVKLRGRYMDESWAPWWRAQAEAIAEVARDDGLPSQVVDRYLKKEMGFVAYLERKAATRPTDEANKP